MGEAPEGGVLLEVVKVGAPDIPIDRIFPFLAVFAVANTALINMLMASRLLYGLAHQDVLPRTLGKVSPHRRAPYVGILFSTVLALGLIMYVASRAEDEIVLNLSSVTVAAAALRLHDRQRRLPGAAPRHRAPRHLPLAGLTPALAAVLCAFLVGPWVDRPALVYQIAGGLMVIGIVLWALTWMTNRGIRAKKTGFRDIDHMEDVADRPPERAVRYQHGCRRPPGRADHRRHADAVGARGHDRARSTSSGLGRPPGPARQRVVRRRAGRGRSSSHRCMLPSFVVGWLLVLRRAGGVIGWLLLANWLVLLTFGFASTYAGYSYSPTSHGDLPGARLAAMWDTHGWPLLFVALVAIACRAARTARCSRRRVATGRVCSASFSFAATL